MSVVVDPFCSAPSSAGSVGDVVGLVQAVGMLGLSVARPARDLDALASAGWLVRSSARPRRAQRLRRRARTSTRPVTVVAR